LLSAKKFVLTGETKMGRTIYVFDADNARAALDQIKNEAVASGGEDGGRIAALTGIARTFLDRADTSRRWSPELLKTFSLYRAACDLIFAMLEFDPLTLDALSKTLDGTAKAPTLLRKVNSRLERDWEIGELERRERRKEQRKYK
jgi:hypothetical protein